MVFQQILQINIIVAEQNQGFFSCFLESFVAKESFTVFLCEQQKQPTLPAYNMKIVVEIVDCLDLLKNSTEIWLLHIQKLYRVAVHRFQADANDARLHGAYVALAVEPVLPSEELSNSHWAGVFVGFERIHVAGGELMASHHLLHRNGYLDVADF